MTLGYQDLKRLRALRDGLSRIVRPQALAFPGRLDEGRLPSSPLDGVDVADASLALVGTFNRALPGEHVVWLQVGTIASGDEWEVSIASSVLGGGESVSIPSVTDDATVYATAVAAALDGLRATWNLDSENANWISVEVLPDEVTIRLRFADWIRVDLDDVSGPGTGLRVVQEAATVSFEVYGLEPSSSTWVRIESAGRTFSGQGGSVPVDVSGFSRVFVSVTSTDGLCVPFVAVSTASDNAADLVAAATVEIEALRAQIPTKLADPAFDDLQGGPFGSEPADLKTSPSSGGPDLYHALRGALLAVFSFIDADRLTPERLSRLSRSISDVVPFVPLVVEGAAVLPDVLAVKFRNRPDLYAELQRETLDAIESVADNVLPEDPDEALDFLSSFSSFLG